MNQPKVSVVCIAYNQERYIKDALDSMLAQETNFEYEILVHDDASTDQTAEIIKAYEKAYPTIVKGMYQQVNQYSKGIKMFDLNVQRAKGKFIALCEGDDYWIDSTKLQKQVDYMESHPECSLCVHAVYKVNPKKERLNTHIRSSVGNKTFSTEEVIVGGGALFGTNSMMYVRELVMDLPAFYHNAPVEDTPLCVYLALQGDVYYLDEFMSAYRVDVPGSWSKVTFSNQKNRRLAGARLMSMLNEMDSYTNHEYVSTINQVKQSITRKYLT